jgi:hypothetical protein
VAPTYATLADCLAYSEGLTVSDNAAFDRLIERAEGDVDQLLVTVPYLTEGGRKYDADGLAALEDFDREALRRATCAQAEYRVTMGEPFFRKHQFSEVAGPDFTTKGTLPMIGPKVLRELQGSSIFRLTTTTSGKQDENPWEDFERG